MLELTFDADARALYAYFTDINEGDDASQLEIPGVFLLDAAGQIVGVRLQLASAPKKSFLQYAQGFEELSYDEAAQQLTLSFGQHVVAATEELPYDAIVDLDRKGRALGLEVQAMIEFGLNERLEVLNPWLVAFDEESDDEFEADEDADDEQAAAKLEVKPEPTAEDEDEARPAVHQPIKLNPNLPKPLLPTDQEVHSGFVALVGKPNVGKSTLLNAYLGQKVSIVSPKPQTTRVPVRGILNGPDAQIIFVDTPGIHKPRHKLGNFMVDVAKRAVPNADVICFMVDITVPPNRMDREIAQMVLLSRKPHILVLNKVDATDEADKHLQEYRDLAPWEMEVAVSARDKLGMETLLAEIVQRLPVGHRLYPEDQLSDVSERSLVAEMIREKVMLNTEEEIPHSIAVEVEEWEDRGKVVYIRANISVEKDSQKGIIIGAGGSMLRKIGATSRFEIERSLGRQIYLDLWIKVRENWRQKPNELRWLGYDVKFFRD
ncbi:MAG TPA: GTPase Era [Herpetosiphon sp.]|uniref:GTPase Era n=1 Tax=Herpetosiphon aurantiacus (strain ATCC 23779 / DSM 785 / 114-95) TaxID=316274 RepID=A9B704_HERA2|nr:GTPase Era [Herpetosiphon sp.]ABX05872.1 GTP-binding protein Era [Herpetosiphon aurantiacus DSM 785]HBW50061.1 GTPase Era [Herpetosiphon sp.]